MTSNPKQSTTMSPLKERHIALALSRRSCLASPDSRFTSRMRRKPARRALFELSHNDRRIERRRNLTFAEDLLTIPVAEFKRKWNFDPVKMKPTNQIHGDNSLVSSDRIAADRADGEVIPRYEWKPLNENTEKKILEKELCSLAPNSARSMRLSYLAMRPNLQNETPVLEEEDSNSTLVHNANVRDEAPEDSSNIEFNSTNTSFELSSSVEKLQESVLLAENNQDSSVETPLEAGSLLESPGKPSPAVKPGDGENKEGVQKSISVVTTDKERSSSTASIDPAPTECIPVTAQPKNNSAEKNTKQLKITDFACQRKRVHNEGLLVAADNPPAKRLRPLI